MIGTVVAQEYARIKSITHPLMLDRYNLRGQEASDDSDAFFFCAIEVTGNGETERRPVAALDRAAQCNGRILDGCWLLVLS